MKHNRLFTLSAIVSAMLLAGCNSSVSEKDVQAAKDFLDGIQENQDVAVDTESALNANYLSTGTAATGYGNARVGGVVDETATSARLRGGNRPAAKIDSSSNIKVFLLKGDGAREELTLAAANKEINPNNQNQFLIRGLSNDSMFVVQVVTDTGKTLETLAYIEKGADSTKVTVSPASTVATRTVENRLVNAYFETGGEKLSANYINDLKIKIQEVFGNATELGLDTAITTTDASNEAELQNVINKIVENKGVANEIEVLETSATAAKYQESTAGPTTKEKARDYIRRLFNSLGDDDGGDVPEYIVKFFGDTYYNEAASGATRPARDVLKAVYDGLTFKQTDLASTFSLTNALEQLSADLKDLYNGIDRIKALEAKTSLTSAEKDELTDLRDDFKQDEVKVILGVFPVKEKTKWSAINKDTQVGVPQGVTLVFYILDVYLAELNTQVRNQDGKLEDSSQFDFNEEPLLAAFGWDPNNIPLDYQGVGINWLEVRTDRYWNGTEDKDVLAAYTCVEALGNGFDVKGVTLSIPTGAGGTSVVSMNKDDHGGGPGGSGACFNLDPWRIVDKLIQDNPDDYKNDGGFTNHDKAWQYADNQNLIINDFGSGNYVVKVSYTQNDTAKEDSFTFDKLIIRGLRKLRPVLTYPLEEPRHPEGAVGPTEFEAFQTAQANYKITTVASGVGFEVKWQAAKLEGIQLPENVVAVYSLDIGRDVCKDTDSDGFPDFCQWQNIWSSWQLGSFIFGTSIVVPVTLPELQLTDSAYHVNLRVEFVNKNTGEFVGAGGDSRAPLRVGAALDTSKPFSIVGNVTGIPNGNADLIRAAIMEEACYDDPNTFQWICSAKILTESDVDKTNGRYSLSMTLDAAMNNSTGGHRQVVLYIDQNNDGKYTIDANDPWKRVDALVFPDTWLNLEVWGGMLHATGEKNCKYDQQGNKQGCAWYDIVVFPDSQVAGPAFDLGGYFGKFDLKGTVTGTDGSEYVAALAKHKDCQPNTACVPDIIATAKVVNGAYLFDNLNIRDLMNPPANVFIFKDTNKDGLNNDNNGQWNPNNFWFGDWDGRLHYPSGKKICDDPNNPNNCYDEQPVVNAGDTVTVPEIKVN